jgi:hypothetical protein
MNNVPKLVELTDTEVDVVAGGQSNAGGLVAVAVNTGDVLILSQHGIDVNVNDALKDIANNNHIGVGVLANILGGPAFLLQRA